MGLAQVILALTAILILIVFLTYRRYSHWKLMGAPYIKPIIPYGNLKYPGKRVHPCVLLKRFYDYYRDKGLFVGIYFLFNPVALLTDLNLIKNILIRDFNYFHDRGHYFNEQHDPMSAHLFAIYGNKWKKIRSKMTPTFSSGRMKTMFPVVVEIGYRLQQRLGELCAENEEVEMKHLLGQFTTDVIGTTAFGLECNSLNGLNQDFREMGRRVFEEPRHKILTVLVLLSLKKYAQKLGIKMVRDDVSEFYTEIIRKTLEYRDQTKIKRNDFIDLLIDLRDHHGLTFEEIAAQAYVFLVAGFETSSTLQTFCVFEMAYNQHVQRKVQKDVRRVLAKYGGKLTYESLSEMTYLEQVMQETLRKYPPVPNLTRIADRDYKVPRTKFVFKKGTVIDIPIFAIQRDPNYYPSPDVFDPDNFLPERMAERHQMTHLPFGDGPRVCIGLRFGIMQAKIGLAVMFDKFQFLPSKKSRYPVDFLPETFTLQPEGGMPLIVRPAPSN